MVNLGLKLLNPKNFQAIDIIHDYLSWSSLRFRPDKAAKRACDLVHVVLVTCDLLSIPCTGMMVEAVVISSSS